MYYVYILRSIKNGKFYVGSTNDLTERLRCHNNGLNIYTRSRGPFELAHSEMYTSRAEAVRRELKIKSYKGGAAFKKLVSK